MNIEKMYQEFVERLNKMTAEELKAAIEKAQEDSKDSWIMEDEDVVHVVRCKDCKSYKDSRCFFTMRKHGLHDDWFCADGERRGRL